MKPILEIKNISKKFRISHEQQPYLSIRDSVANIFKSKTSTEDFWALNDVCFDVHPGETIGIIGKNGAGKSTLLKILSKITPPTSGKIISRGRIASLLEVGTGFHPELSGRENIFLNGSILGMKRAEINNKFDEIVDFSGVEKFIDTPLKHYSSGMQLRLAFAVAAFLEPEILVIDEVLAVGDAEFQKKCTNKMESLSKSGLTLLVVSHNMASIQALAQKGVFLSGGTTVGKEEIKEVVNKYMFGTSEESASEFYNKKENKTKEAMILSVKLRDTAHSLRNRFKTIEDIFLEIEWVNISAKKINPNFMLLNEKGQTVMVALDTPLDFYGDKKSEAGRYLSRFKIPGNLLNTGFFSVSAALDCASPAYCYDSHANVLHFNIWDAMDEHSVARGNFTIVREDAVLFPALECELKKLD